MTGDDMVARGIMIIEVEQGRRQKELVRVRRTRPHYTGMITVLEKDVASLDHVLMLLAEL